VERKSIKKFKKKTQNKMVINDATYWKKTFHIIKNTDSKAEK
jgi:regulator of extracellular matrix RemA (YlzA/DUF370 family)